MSDVFLATDDMPLAAELRAVRPAWSFSIATDERSASMLRSQTEAEVAIFDRRASWVTEGMLREARTGAGSTVIALVPDLQVSEAVRNSRLAHQVITASSPPSMIASLCERAMTVGRIVNDERVINIVSSAPDLSAPPEIWLRLNEVLEDPNSTAAHVATVVGSDAVVAAHVMRLANSAYFGLSRHVSQLHTAVSLLGFTTIRALVLESTASRVAPVSFPELKRQEVQAHSMAVARVARSIAGSAHQSDAFVAGLLMDVGLAVMASVMPADLRSAMTQAASEGRPLQDVEMDRFGFTHAAVGACLLGLWGLPYGVLDAVAHHHTEPNFSGSLSVRETLYLARDGVQSYGPFDPYDVSGALIRQEPLDMSVALLIDSARSVASEPDNNAL